MAQDYPDGFRRNLAGHTVDLESGFSLPWAESTKLTIAAAGNSSFTINFSNPDWIYYVDMINVSPQAYTEFYIFVEVNGVTYTAGANMGFIILPLRTNPSINFIDGDSVKVTVYNKDASQRTFVVHINGSKIVRPSNFGHVPGAQFSFSPGSALPDEDITFTDESTGSPTSWEWDFDDGSEHSFEQNPVHAYSELGSYYPTLKATNEYGYDVYASSIPIIIFTYQLLSSYTEVDAGGYLTVGTYRVTATNIPTNAAAYLYKDFGAGYFNAISHRFSFKITGMSADNCTVFVYGLTNSVATLYSGAGWKTTLYVVRAGGLYYLYLRTYNGTSVITDDYMQISLNTQYYIDVSHLVDSSVFTVKVYSDSAYSNLLDTLVIDTNYNKTTWRYLHALGGAGAGVTNVCNGYTENYLV